MKRLFQSNPQQWKPDYLRFIDDLKFWSISYDKKEVLNYYEEFIQYIEKLTITEPKTWENVYYVELKNILNFCIELDDIACIRKYQKELLSYIDNLCKKKPLEWGNIYFELLNEFASYYENIDNYEESLIYRIDCVVYIEKLLEKESTWELEYINSLRKLVNCYKYMDDSEKSLDNEKKLLEIEKNLYEKAPTIWSESYLKDLAVIGSILIKNNDLIGSLEYLKEYFKIFDIRSIETVDLIETLIYPFVEYYYVTVENQLSTKELDEYIKKQKKYLLKTFDFDYDGQVYEKHKKYLENAKLEDNIYKVKLKIFEKLFIKQNFIAKIFR